MIHVTHMNSSAPSPSFHRHGRKSRRLFGTALFVDAGLFLTCMAHLVADSKHLGLFCTFLFARIVKTFIFIISFRRCKSLFDMRVHFVADRAQSGLFCTSLFVGTIKTSLLYVSFVRLKFFGHAWQTLSQIERM